MQCPFTLSDLLAAWERVLENEGCAGADGVTLERFAHDPEARLGKLLDLVAAGEYRPFPLLTIVVEKKPGSGQTRTLLVPAVRDRVLQTAAARALSRSFEEEFLECSFGYRPGRSVDRAIARIRELHFQGFEFVVDADIQAFFDNVDHELLFERLRSIGELGPCSGCGFAPRRGMAAQSLPSSRVCRKARRFPRCWPTSSSKTSTANSSRVDANWSVTPTTS